MYIDISEHIERLSKEAEAFTIKARALSAELKEKANRIETQLPNNVSSPDRYKRTIYMLETILKHYRFAQLDSDTHYDFIDPKHNWRDTMFASAYNSGDDVSQTLRSLIDEHYQDIIKIFTYLTYNTGSLDDDNVDIFINRIVKATWPVLFNGDLYRNDSNNYRFVNIPVHELQLYRVLKLKKTDQPKLVSLLHTSY